MRWLRYRWPAYAVSGLLACLPLATGAAVLEEQGATGDTMVRGLSGDRATRLNLGIVAGVTTYGVAAWEWGQSGFHTRSEGWFGMQTRHGGADKLGHAYSGAVTTAITAGLYRRWGYDDIRAARLGAGSGLLLTTAVELGDGLSPEHGFSWEDQLVNMAGVGLEYLRQRHPDLAQRLQFRWEYWPSPAVRHGDHFDITTDYSGSRWLLALPLRGWGVTGSWLGWLEIQAGYGTRGFAERDRPYFDGPSRHPFIGVGIHMPLVLGRLGASSDVQRVFEYLQIPGTALPLPP